MTNFGDKIVLVRVGLVKGVGEIRVQLNMLLDFIDRRMPVKGSLSPPVVGLVEACQQYLEISMPRYIDAEDFAGDTTVEALDHSISLRSIGLCFAANDFEFVEGTLKIISGET